MQTGTTSPAIFKCPLWRYDPFDQRGALFGGSRFLKEFEPRIRYNTVKGVQTMRGKVKIKERLEARKLRSEGISLKTIAKMLSQPFSSVRQWVIDIELTQEQKKKLSDLNESNRSRAHSETRKKRRLEFQKSGAMMAQKHEWNFAAGCMLYWGEGSKDKNSVVMTNTDPELLLFFLNFLRTFYEVKNDEITINVYAYSGNGKTKEEIESYWCEKLGLPRSALRKTLMDYDLRSKKGNRNTIHLYGGCRLRVKSSTRIVQSIFGAIQEYGSFKREEWLMGSKSKQSRRFPVTEEKTGASPADPANKGVVQ